MLSLLFQYIWGQAEPGGATGLLLDKLQGLLETPNYVGEFGVNKRDFRRYLVLTSALEETKKPI
jgi:hypothetical protein